ncbi:hypothetical protein JCM13991_19290 [Thermodesulfovibrio hydrogeniphilus]
MDNSPDPEPEDINAHLHGGILKIEVELINEKMRRFGFDYKDLINEKNEKYFEFKVDEKSKIREFIDASRGIKEIIKKEIIKKHKSSLNEWWNEILSEFENISSNNLWRFRNNAKEKLKEKLLPLSLLDEFKIAGIFVNWWEDLRYDFKSIISSGWRAELVEEEMIKEKFFKEDNEEIENIEAKITELEGELNEILEEIEDWDEEEMGQKTGSKAIAYIEETYGIKYSKNMAILSLSEEQRKGYELIIKIKGKSEELKKLNKKFNELKKELEKKIKEKLESLTQEEAKELILEKFYNKIDEQMNKYLNAEKKELVKYFENLWDKYQVSMKELLEARDRETEKLNEFLKSLGYL